MRFSTTDVIEVIFRGVYALHGFGSGDLQDGLGQSARTASDIQP
jgi:hypothetical protein